MSEKAKYWVAILWCENLMDNWQNLLDEKIQNPYVYCIHDKDTDSKNEQRKPHVHIMIAFPNTTTYNHALTIFKSFSKTSQWVDPDTFEEHEMRKECCNTCKRVLNVRYMYDYLIHDTDESRKKHKYQYDPSERICGLNFDIGLLEQVSLSDKHEMVKALSMLIIERNITNYADFYLEVMREFDSAYLELILGYSTHFKELCKACYLKLLK